MRASTHGGVLGEQAQRVVDVSADARQFVEEPVSVPGRQVLQPLTRACREKCVCVKYACTSEEIRSSSHSVAPAESVCVCVCVCVVCVRLTYLQRRSP